MQDLVQTAGYVMLRCVLWEDMLGIKPLTEILRRDVFGWEVELRLEPIQQTIKERKEELARQGPPKPITRQLAVREAYQGMWCSRVLGEALVKWHEMNPPPSPPPWMLSERSDFSAFDIRKPAQDTDTKD